MSRQAIRHAPAAEGHGSCHGKQHAMLPLPRATNQAIPLAPAAHLHGVDAHGCSTRQPISPLVGVDAEVVHAAGQGRAKGRQWCQACRQREAREAGGRGGGAVGGPPRCWPRPLTCPR